MPGSSGRDEGGAGSIMARRWQETAGALRAGKVAAMHDILRDFWPNEGPPTTWLGRGSFSDVGCAGGSPIDAEKWMEREKSGREKRKERRREGEERRGKREKEKVFGCSGSQVFKTRIYTLLGFSKQSFNFTKIGSCFRYFAITKLVQAFEFSSLN